MTFYHQHCHSDFSLLDALTKVDDAARRAANHGQPALALTDHGTMAGLVQHYQACRRHSIIPIMGLEAYLVQNAATHQEEVKAVAAEINSLARKQGERKNVTTTQREASALRDHCLLWARDFEGYQILTRAMTKAYAQMYYKPLLDISDIAELGRSGKVMMSTGCVSGEIPRLIRQKKIQAAWERFKFYRETFRENFIVELQFHGLDDINERLLNHCLHQWADTLSVPVICTGDVHYLDSTDHDAHSFYKRMVYKKPEGGYGGDGYWLSSSEEMAPRFTPEQWDVSQAGLAHVLERCKDISFPPLDSYSYAVPQIVKTDPDKVLRLITEGAMKNPSVEYTERLELELGVIRDTEFAQYFLFVRSIVKFCEDNDIFFVARGSASGSLVCFLLGITQLDPITNGLLFERFLSNDRSKPPDIDLDVEDERRDEVLRYISQRFETTQIGTCLTFASKSAHNEVLAQTRLDLQHTGIYMEGTSDDDLLQLDSTKEYLKAITGVARGLGGHPAGVVAETPGRSVRDLVPLSFISSSERWITQYDMDDIEALGFVKVDILGVRALRIIRKCLAHLGHSNWDWIPDDDLATFKLLQSGRTDGIFTFKGWSNKKGCKLLKPKSLDDCSLVAAIWRPSCLELGLEELFLERRKARWKPPEDWHPAIGHNLRETFGIAVYQEQVIQIMKAFGFVPDEVMVMLRAVKKKDPKLMKVIHDRLDELVDEKTSKHVWELMEGYTRYGFNKCVSGDTVVHRASGNQYQPPQVTIKQLWDVWNEAKSTPWGKKLRAGKVSILQMDDDGRVRPGYIKRLIYQGEQQLVRVCTESGNEIRVTANHRLLTERGYVEAALLRQDDYLVSVGEYEPTERMLVGSSAKGNTYQGKGFKTGQLNPAYVDGRQEALASAKLTVRQRSGESCERCGARPGDQKHGLEFAHQQTLVDLNGSYIKYHHSDNLEHLCNSCHKKFDYEKGERRPRWSKGRPTHLDRVEYVHQDGLEDTWDLEMDTEGHNFVANGIVSHNSHSYSYARIGYRMAYLKANHPLQFMAAVLECETEKTNQQLYMQEARRLDLRILPVCINSSDVTWTVERNSLRRGFTSVTGVGEKAARALVQARPFSTLAELREKATSTANLGVLKKLAEVGAFRAMGIMDEIELVQQLEKP